MAVNYNTTVKDARMTVVRDAIDAGASAGVLELCSAGYADVLAKRKEQLARDAIDLATVGAADGNAALARFKDSDGTIIADGLTVGTAGTNVVLNTTGIETGKPVIITSATITHG